MSLAISHPAETGTDPAAGLQFLWLELTNRCNLVCVHCYADSSPHPTRADVLDTDDFARLLQEAAALGCRAVQFIGGEPTLHPGLPRLIVHARALGFTQIEVYTNATHLPPSLLECFVRNGVAVAVSVYGDNAATHDAVTARAGSHRRTIANLKRVVEAGLALRAGVVALDSNRHRIDETLAFLDDLGIKQVRVDAVRAVGRGVDVTTGDDGLQALCGACWQGRLCVAPDGGVSPCIMSKGCSVGSVTRSSLAEIVASAALRHHRARIRTEVWEPRQGEDGARLCQPKPCDPDGCMPTLICPPSDPTKPCTPVTGRQQSQPPADQDCMPTLICPPSDPTKPCSPVTGWRERRSPDGTAA